MTVKRQKRPKKILNSLLKSYLNYRYKRIAYFKSYPIRAQQTVFQGLIDTAKDTQWGRKYKYSTIETYQDFVRSVPIHQYDDLKPYIYRMMHGERDVLWPGVVEYFARSSGTTSDKSKYIPVSQENLDDCHIQGSWDSVVIFYRLSDDAAIFLNKNIVIPGSIGPFAGYPDTLLGDISAIMVHAMPGIGRMFYVPDMETALSENWEEKLEKTAKLVAQRRDIGMFGGVPTWNMVLFKRVLEMTGAAHLKELWPDLQAYFHGGVGFGPYRHQFEKLIPDPNFEYLEIYNATEGFFATQDDFDSDDLLLLLDNGMFFEFIPMDSYDEDDLKAIPLEEVQLGKNYAILVSTNSGLWRYLVGDTVVFTSIKPYKIKITGRTKAFINVFGEELMISNAEKALAQACAKTDALVADYSVAPVFLSTKNRGCHQWLIEFEKRPKDIDQFAQILDKCLQEVNSDYEAKRHKSMALKQLIINDLPQGTFFNWMKSRKKLGNQNKVPRLSNSRKIIEEILKFVQQSNGNAKS